MELMCLRRRTMSSIPPAASHVREPPPPTPIDANEMVTGRHTLRCSSPCSPASRVQLGMGTIFPRPPFPLTDVVADSLPRSTRRRAQREMRAIRGGSSVIVDALTGGNSHDSQTELRLGRGCGRHRRLPSVLLPTSTVAHKEEEGPHPSFPKLEGGFCKKIIHCWNMCVLTCGSH
jgi:hypothetical protein